MNKNAHDYTECASNALKQAVQDLQSALQTVEKPENRDKIQQSLQAVESAYNQTCNTCDALAQQ